MGWGKDGAEAVRQASWWMSWNERYGQVADFGADERCVCVVVRMDKIRTKYGLFSWGERFFLFFSRARSCMIYLQGCQNRRGQILNRTDGFDTLVPIATNLFFFSVLLCTAHLPVQLLITKTINNRSIHVHTYNTKKNKQCKTGHTECLCVWERETALWRDTNKTSKNDKERIWMSKQNKAHIH